METAYVTAQVSFVTGLDHVSLYYATGLVGNFTEIQMLDDGLHHDGAANDGIYGADLPAYPAGTWVRMYVEAIANNPAKSAAYMPRGAEHDVYIYNVSAQNAGNPSLVINEIMASNVSTVTDEMGEYEDWIEIFNPTANTVNLTGWHLSDNPANLAKWEFPAGHTLAAGAYLIVWADEDSSQGPMHANFKLSSTNGETVWLLDSALSVVDSVQFPPQADDMGWARRPNGGGPFVSQAPTFNSNNDFPLAVSHAAPVGGLLVFPNPAGSVLNIRNLGAATEHLSVYDAVGKLMGELELDEVGQIATAQYPAGVYYLRGTEAVVKFVVVH
jgi:hypothetical protein